MKFSLPVGDILGAIYESKCLKISRFGLGMMKFLFVVSLVTYLTCFDIQLFWNL